MHLLFLNFEFSFVINLSRTDTEHNDLSKLCLYYSSISIVVGI